MEVQGQAQYCGIPMYTLCTPRASHTGPGPGGTRNVVRSDFVPCLELKICPRAPPFPRAHPFSTTIPRGTLLSGPHLASCLPMSSGL